MCNGPILKKMLLFILIAEDTARNCIECPSAVHTGYRKRGAAMNYRILLAVLVVIALAIVIGSGFDLRGDVVLGGYREHADGGAVTVEVDVTSPMGYVRSAKERQEGGCLYVSFYSAFGGHNGSIGAKDSFELQTPTDCREIYFYCDGDGYDLVLRREDASSSWERVGQ